MQRNTRIYSWEYDERKILCNVKTTLDVEARIFWDAIKKYRTTVSLGKGSPKSHILTFQSESRPMVFIAYSLGGLIVKKVSRK